MGRRFELVKSNKIFFLMMVVQMLVILILGIASIVVPANSMLLTPEMFMENHDLVTIDESKIQCTKSEGVTMDIYSRELQFASGGYQFVVYYDTNPSSSRRTNVGSSTIEFLSRYGIDSISISLDEGHTSATGAFWIPWGMTNDEVYAKVKFNGNGSLNIYKVEICEQRIYRVVRVGALLLLFSLIDVIYYYFWNERTVIEEKQKRGIIIVGIIFVASLPLFVDYLFAAHDMTYHLTRIAGLARELKNGQLPVRMMHSVANDFGYPNSIFYGDIFLYIPAFLYNCMVPLRTCYQIYIFIANLATCLIAYLCFSKIGKDRKLGLIGALIYTLCSWRMVNIFLRGAVGEYSAMIFLPLVVLGMYQIYTKEKSKLYDWLPLALGMAGCILCHIITPWLVFMILVLFIVLNISHTVKKGRIIALMKAGITAFMLTAWFFVPLIEGYLGKGTQASNSGIVWLQSTGVYPLQLFLPFLTGNVYAANQYNTLIGEMPLTIGGGLVVGLGIMVYCLVKRNDWNLSSKTEYRAYKKVFVMSVLTMVMMLNCFPWTQIQNMLSEEMNNLLSTIQFLWRLLTPASVLLVTGVILALRMIKENSDKAYIISVVGVCAATLLSTGFFYYQMADIGIVRKDSVRQERDLMDIGGGNYLPVGFENMDGLALSECQIVDGELSYLNYWKEDDVRYLACGNENTEKAVVHLPILAYENYHAYDCVSENELEIELGGRGQLLLTIPAGYDGTIEIVYQPPVLWKVMEIVSFLAFTAVIGMIVIEKKKQRI